MQPVSHAGALYYAVRGCHQHLHRPLVWLRGLDTDISSRQAEGMEQCFSSAARAWSGTARHQYHSHQQEPVRMCPLYH